MRATPVGSGPANWCNLYGWVSDDPLILHQHLDETLQLPEQRVYRLATLAWHWSSGPLCAAYRQNCAAAPCHPLTFLLADYAIYRDLYDRGVPAVLVSHNTFVDERVFRILPGAEKRYDAVYVARMVPFKRHALARKIPQPLMIGHAGSSEAAYFAEVQQALPQAHFTHADCNRSLTSDEVTQALNSARVGLCLSATEGASWASVEYLLCGLPVVSTYNRGGRNEFLDLRYCRLVPPEPQALADAVRELIALDLPAEWVREQTLVRLREHRQRFVDLVQSIYDRTGVARDYQAEFEAGFYNRMGRWRTQQAPLELLDEDRRYLRRIPLDHAAQRRPERAGGYSRYYLPAPAPATSPGTDNRQHVAACLFPLDPEPHQSWPDPVLLGIAGPGLAAVWRSVQHALEVHCQHAVAVRLHAVWYGLPAGEFGQLPPIDRSGLARELLATLAGNSAVEIVNGWPEADISFLWFSPRRLFPAVVAPSAWRWQGWKDARRITCARSASAARAPSSAVPDLAAHLEALAPDLDVIGLDEQSPVAANAAALAASNLFVGGPGDLSELACAIGVPVFLIVPDKDLAGENCQRDNPPTIACRSIADCVWKLRCFLGEPADRAPTLSMTDARSLIP